MANIAFVNGKWSPLSAATISIEDRGFQFGDGVYEVIRTYHKQPFRVEAHLARLKISADAIGIAIPYSFSEMEKIIRSGCQKTQFSETQVYIQITRGMAPRNHRFPKRVRPTVVMTFRKCKTPSHKMRRDGVSIVTVTDTRWARCYVKSLNLLPNVLARERALKSDAMEAIFVREGKVMEGAGSNLFAVFGRSVITPPDGLHILSGITKSMVIQLVKKQGLRMQEKTLTLRRLATADEIFLSGTTIEVLPVTRLDGKIVESGQPGRITKILYEAFQEEILRV
ncbi:MAG: D-amino-acid transaminase [Nitrospira sp.]|nr:D-amino-acid transaminase [Candidatus Manganitrophaceae bacterium]HIL35320.1 D-amino-acid transaminase [Candidatus Manganitrophaceae bacterium]